MRPHVRSNFALSALVVLGPSLAAQTPIPQWKECRPGAKVDPQALLSRSIHALGIDATGDRVLHFKSRESSSAREQSDRWYPPYLNSVVARDVWVDPKTGAERHTFDTTWPGTGNNAGTVLTLESATFAVRDTAVVPVPQAHNSTRALRLLDPWAVVLDWSKDSTVRFAGECMFRDYWRTVLAREAVEGKQELYIDPRSSYPVKLQYDEPHYLWGQLHVESLYTTWITPRGGGSFPGSVIRVEDGEIATNRTISGRDIVLVPRDSAPRLEAPAGAADMRRKPSPTISAAAPQIADTVRVGAQTFLLVTPAYTETVTLQRDTVFLLDATTSEGRARGDSIWIARLFPGKHPVAVVVTDLAWPHVSGVRFWVARNATIISHHGSTGFLQKLTAQRWTLTPDALERSTAKRGSALRIRTLGDSMSLGGGAIKLYTIDGAASEGALMAFVASEKYLWASDFIQTVARPSQYATEVWNAAKRVGITPDRFAAEHVGLTPWSKVADVNR
jgi:hypothetical protein